MKKIIIIVALIIMCILSIWYMHSLFYSSPSFMKLSTTEYYSTDQALTEYLSKKDNFTKNDGYENALYFSKNDLEEEIDSYTDYRLWAAFIIQNGRRLIHIIDSYYNRILERDLSKNTVIDSLNLDLVYLSRFHQSLRNFGEDVDEFTTLMNTTGINQKSSEIISVNIIRNELNVTYQQTFTLLNTKLNEYSENKISFTNILISIIALLIALISLILSLSSNKRTS